MSDINIKKLLKKLLNDDSDRKISKSVPGDPAWPKRYQDLEKLCEEAQQLEGRIKVLRDRWWGDIQEFVNDYTSDKRYNDQTNEVEFLVDDDERITAGKPIPSPFQKNG